jgi:hypothetical protein
MPGGYARIGNAARTLRAAFRILANTGLRGKSCKWRPEVVH